jgi:hypothetical protein
VVLTALVDDAVCCCFIARPWMCKAACVVCATESQAFGEDSGGAAAITRETSPHGGPPLTVGMHACIRDKSQAASCILDLLKRTWFREKRTNVWFINISNSARSISSWRRWWKIERERWCVWIRFVRLSSFLRLGVSGRKTTSAHILLIKGLIILLLIAMDG